MNISEILNKIAHPLQTDNLQELTELFYQSIQSLPDVQKSDFEKQYQAIVKQKLTKISKELNEMERALDHAKEKV